MQNSQHNTEEKNKVGGFTLLGFKTQRKTTVIKLSDTVKTGRAIDAQIKRIESKAQK